MLDQSLPVPRGLFSKRPTYLLRVRGESMKDAGILAAPRQGWVRISPHFYITPEQIDRMIDLLP